MWSSADPGVATVSPTGTVAGMAVGTAVVTATADSVSATATIQVQATPRRVLVDASRDGGVWWFPQWEQGGFDPNLDHQGQKLAEGSVREVENNLKVAEVYLGREKISAAP